MNKFNLAQRNLLKDRRAKRAHLRRLRSGNPALKLPLQPSAQSTSGKRSRKLLKKWRRAQKNALESGLVSMQDIEMIAADNLDTDKGAPTIQQEETQQQRFHVKKRLKLRMKKSNKKSKRSNISPQSNEDVMIQ